MNPQLPRLTLPCLALLVLGACAPGEPAAIASAQAGIAPQAAPAQTQTPAPVAAPVAASNGLPAMLVHKQESCGCCATWVEHMRHAGFEVEVRNVQDMQPIKSQLGVPYGMGSCHTAEVGGYFIEGHVPAEDIKRLLAERPQAKGLALPGMPVGSPGMEHPQGLKQPYSVALIDTEGHAQAYSEHNQP